MSVLVASIVVGCGMILGRLMITQKKRTEKSRAAPAAQSAEPEPEEKTTVLPGFPCALGDVVLRTGSSQRGGDEAWLAGALVMREGDEPAAVMFFSPEAGGDRAVLSRPSSETLAWLSQDKSVTIASGEPPTALEASGERYERRQRLPLRAERIGTGAPELGPELIFAEYTGLGDECLIVLATKERVLAFRGTTLGPGTYDVLPGKKE